MVWDWLIFCLIVGGVLLIYMIRQAFLNQVVEQEISFADFPATFGEVSLFFISDIHRRIIHDSLIQKVKGRAELVIIGGDLMEKGVPFEKVALNLKKLREIGPVFFVWGNNDYEVDFHRLDALMLDMGVKILANTAVTLESREGEKLCLLGVDDMSQERDRLDWALHDASDKSFKLLVSHYPDIAAQVLPEHQIRLVLSGHTHGGQIHLFGYSPYKRGGLEKAAHTMLFISNGYGTTAVPFRLGAPAQTHLITLKKG